jgi:hypothetical protein
MPLFDKVKAQATQVAQKAQEAGKAGQAKLDEVQAKRKADGLFRDLGAAVYAERTGTGGPDTTAEIDRLVEAITAHETEHAAAEAGESEAAAEAGKSSESSESSES